MTAKEAALSELVSSNTTYINEEFENEKKQIRNLIYNFLEEKFNKATDNEEKYLIACQQRLNENIEDHEKVIHEYTCLHYKETADLFIAKLNHLQEEIFDFLRKKYTEEFKNLTFKRLTNCFYQ